ncbi:hypothetical protein [Pseudomonas gingeri]|nr:hypothetical protein [Pseudomonas gingeri]
MAREEDASGHRDSLGIHLLGLGVGAGLIIGLTLLTCLLLVNFH